MVQSQFKFLRPEDIQKLSSYEFVPKAVVEGYFSGRHRSRIRGASTEFNDYRPYAPGDDTKLVDWRVYARTDRYYLRLFEQETNMDCFIFLDSSASMAFGAGVTKIEYASFFAAALSYLVTRYIDRVGLTIFDREIRHFFPPGSTSRHFQNLMHALEKNRAGERTSVATALRRAFPLLRQRGILILLSDFFDKPGEIFSALNLYLHRGFKVYLFHILTPFEIELEDQGLRQFVDMETGEEIVANSGDIGRDYRSAMERHIRHLRELSIRRQVSYTLARTDRHFFTLFDELVE